jgi:hypothetical protein
MSSKTFSDPLFGTLFWNEQVRWWEGVVTLAPGHRVTVSFIPDSDDLDPLLAYVKPLFAAIRADDFPLRRAAAKALLDVYNDEWNDDDPIEAEEFIDRILLDALVYYDDGSAELYYDDDDLFLGHVILVRLDDRGRVTEATIGG